MDAKCKPWVLNHALLVIGYGNTTFINGSYAKHWILKNSWGADWGIQGSMLLARDRKNMCGIASAASYPV